MVLLLGMVLDVLTVPPGVVEGTPVRVGYPVQPEQPAIHRLAFLALVYLVDS